MSGSMFEEAAVGEQTGTDLGRHRDPRVSILLQHCSRGREAVPDPRSVPSKKTKHFYLLLLLGTESKSSLSFQCK